MSWRGEVSAGQGMRQALRLKLRDVLCRVFPTAPAADVFEAVRRIGVVLWREPVDPHYEDAPVPNCACWACVTRLAVEVAQHQALMAAERMAREEVD